MRPKYYYTVQKSNGGYRGAIYHWSEDGNTQITDWTSCHCYTENEARDMAAIQAEKVCPDAEMG